MSTREKILSVTAKIIASEGLDAVSIRYVCEKSEVKAPTVYYYFKDKDGLVDEVVRLAYVKYTKKHNAYIADKDLRTMLVKSWDIFFDFVEVETDLFHAIILAHIKQKIPSEGMKLFLSIAEIFKSLEKINKLALPYYTSAQIFYSTAYGMALVYISQGKNSKLKNNIQLNRDLCIDSLICCKRHS